MRSSQWRCSVRKGVLRNFVKFTGKHQRYTLAQVYYRPSRDDCLLKIRAYGLDSVSLLKMVDNIRKFSNIISTIFWDDFYILNCQRRSYVIQIYEKESGRAPMSVGRSSPPGKYWKKPRIFLLRAEAAARGVL